MAVMFDDEAIGFGTDCWGLPSLTLSKSMEPLVDLSSEFLLGGRFGFGVTDDDLNVSFACT